VNEEPNNRPEYQGIEKWSREEVERALAADVAEALSRAVLAVTLHDDDWRYGQDLCVRLASHAHYLVRGNAVLGLGHLARVFRQLDEKVAYPVIAAALRDEEAYVRGQAECAKDDTAQFLGWKYGTG
jgi:hypothetical protein